MKYYLSLIQHLVVEQLYKSLTYIYFMIILENGLISLIRFSAIMKNVNSLILIGSNKAHSVKSITLKFSMKLLEEQK